MRGLHRTVTEAVTDEVAEERERQDEKWGEQNHPLDTWLTVLAEEVGELAQAILKGRVGEARDEAVQCAAVAVAIIEFIDRDRPPVPHMREDERAALPQNATSAE